MTRHLQGLEKDARDVLEAASVLGRECEVELLRRMGRVRGPRLLEGITELLRRQMMEESISTVGAHVGAQRAVPLRFVHDKIREVAYAGLAPRRATLEDKVVELLRREK